MSIHKVFALAVAGAAIWTFVAQPGIYSGHVQAWFNLLSEEPPDFRDVTMTAERPATWQWSERSPCPYRVVSVAITLDGSSERSMIVQFPGPTYKTRDAEGNLSVDVWMRFLTRPKQGQQTLLAPKQPEPSYGEQGRALYQFLLSVGDGTLPPPRHHTYYVDRPYHGGLTHFIAGVNAGLYLVPGLLAAWALAMIAMRFTGHRPTTPAS